MNTMEARLQQAQRYLAGGVNSPVRAFRYVGGKPRFMERGEGARLYDADGRSYIDYVCSWGAMIVGHAHPAVVDQVREYSGRGLSFGTPTELETALAECICNRVRSIDKLRLVNSGTEAVMSAVRLARGWTGREHIIKFEGCYHGHADSMLVKAGSGALTLGIPDSPGVPASLAQLTLNLPYNDSDVLERGFARHGEHVAAVIVEPIAGNMGCVPPLPGFLQRIRALCSQYGSLLIFDEVMTGFRVAAGGAQALYQVQPDLTTLGKVIGGGLPVGAFGGRAELMDHVAPDGPVYQAGTLAGNPVAMAAGLATLELCDADGFYARLSETTAGLVAGFKEQANAAGIPLAVHQAGGMFGFFFSEEESIARLDQVAACDQDAFRAFFHGMLERGVYLAPSPYEAGFVSSAHQAVDRSQTLEAARDAFACCRPTP